MQDFTEWMNKGVNEECAKNMFLRTKRLLLADGTSLSIQAGNGKYCSPRKDPDIADFDFFDEFEIGFPSKEIKEIISYAEDEENLTSTVYGYVPKELIRSLIAARGGVIGYESDLLLESK